MKKNILLLLAISGFTATQCSEKKSSLKNWTETEYSMDDKNQIKMEMTQHIAGQGAHPEEGLTYGGIIRFKNLKDATEQEKNWAKNTAPVYKEDSYNNLSAATAAVAALNINNNK